jgi:hypothetical protein
VNLDSRSAALCTLGVTNNLGPSRAVTIDNRDKRWNERRYEHRQLTIIERLLAYAPWALA